MSFGKELKRLRKEQGISQLDLANKVFLNHTYISKIESGSQQPPSEQNIILIANALHTDKYDLIMAANKIPTDFAYYILNNKGMQKQLKESVKSGTVKHIKLPTARTTEEIRKELDEKLNGGK